MLKYALLQATETGCDKDSICDDIYQILMLVPSKTIEILAGIPRSILLLGNNTFHISIDII